MIVAIGQQSADMLERIRELERDNRRLRDMLDVVSQRVARSQRRELRVQTEMRQIWRFRFYDRMRIARLEACVRRHLGYRIIMKKMPNTRYGASRTREGINEQIDRQMAGALGARTTARNLEPLMRDGGGQEEVNGNGGNGNGGSGNGRNGNGNGNGGGNGYNFGGFVPARECTYQDFLKCQPLSFNGIEGVVGLTRWFENLETCQPLSFNGTEGVVGLTRWFEKMETVFPISNCPERTYEVDDKSVLSKKRGPKDGDRVMELGCEGKLLIGFIPEDFRNWCCCVLGMVPIEEDKVERFVGGLPDNIQGNGDMLEVLKTREGWITTRETIGSNNQFSSDKMLEARMWQELTRLGTMRKRSMLDLFPTTTSASCTMQGRVLKDYPMLRNQNHGNKTRNKNGNKTGNQTGSNEATTKAYAIRGGGSNPDSNVVTGTFLLNNCYASMLFDSGADWSFVSSTFSALFDVAPSTLDTSYAVELADGRISKTNVVLRGCTLGLL
ncbi:hypothetical protein Tco_1393787 [Tanacetum coccineum]